MQSLFKTTLKSVLSFAILVIAAAATDTRAAGTDTSLVGHWRNTIWQSSTNYAKDTHYKFFHDGSFQMYAKGIANGSKFSEGPQYGRWSADGSVLTLTFASGEQTAVRYVADSRNLVLPGETDYRLWERLQ